MWCALSSYSSHNKGQASARQKKRHREDIEVCPDGAGLGWGALCAQKQQWLREVRVAGVGG